MSREAKFLSGKASQVLFVCLSRCMLGDNRTPVGSGRFRDHAQDPRGVLGMSCSSPLDLGYEGCMAHAHGGPCWGKSRASCSAEAATGNKLELHPSRQE